MGIGIWQLIILNVVVPLKITSMVITPVAIVLDIVIGVVTAII